ncbi:PQQ-dependent sugar dehydrogenase [soil metagenome]
MSNGQRRRPGALRAAIVVALGLVLIAGVPMTASAADFSIKLDRRLPSHLFSAPTQVTNAGDGTNRLFVVERRGTIRVIKGGVLQSGYFLDMRSIVEAGGERGLLGVAFHPRFETNRRLFVIYTRKGGDVVVRRYTANASRTKVSPDTGRHLLVVEHSAKSNHNGGSIAFGPNGYLYFGIGDGGGSGDPENDAQNKSRNLLGKIMRINVNGTGAGPYGRYSIPRSNPFYGSVPGKGEIWAYGLRNPWRISFDRATGSLFIADVGQGQVEEVNREGPKSTGGRNYGWNIMEGRSCYDPSRCPLAGDTLPVAQYRHVDGNCSITGGYVYRGKAYPKLVSQYVFADFCSGRIWSMPASGGSADMVQRADTSQQITSFGEHENGELYAVTIDGKLYRVTAP